jgi:hypothetical protein
MILPLAEIVGLLQQGVGRDEAGEKDLEVGASDCLALAPGRGIPFKARCIRSRATSPLRKGETVEVRRLAKQEACESDMLVQIQWRGRKMADPLSQLAAIHPDESTAEAITLSADYLERACGPDGRFSYEVAPASGRLSPSYNIVRHAGTIYALRMFNGSQSRKLGPRGAKLFDPYRVGGRRRLLVRYESGESLRRACLSRKNFLDKVSGPA